MVKIKEKKCTHEIKNGIVYLLIWTDIEVLC